MCGTKHWVSEIKVLQFRGWIISAPTLPKSIQASILWIVPMVAHSRRHGRFLDWRWHSKQPTARVMAQCTPANTEGAVAGVSFTTTLYTHLSNQIRDHHTVVIFMTHRIRRTFHTKLHWLHSLCKRQCHKPCAGGYIQTSSLMIDSSLWWMHRIPFTATMPKFPELRKK